MTQKTVTRSLWAAVAALLIAASAQATSMRPINLAETVATAEKAFVGEVLGVEVVTLAEGGFAEEVRVRVTRPVFGTTDGEIVTWRQARNGRDVRLPGMPAYTAGEEHLIFLYAKAPGSPFQAPVALGQGSFRVHRNLETGEMYVRNAFMNRHLFMDLDVRAIAEVVAHDEIVRARGLSAAAQARVVAGTESRITRTFDGAMELETFLEVVDALHGVANPVEHFRAAEGQPNRSLRTTATIEPEILQGH